MEKKIVDTIQFTAFVLLILLFLWVLLMVLLTSGIKQDWTDQQYLQFALENRFLYTVSYLNAVVLTILTVALFGLLFLYTKQSKPVLSVLGIVFIPIYGVLNIFAYGTQITVVPQLLAGVNISNIAECEAKSLVQWIQTKPETVVGMINGSAYAIFGIPSVFFGLALYDNMPYGKITCWFLLLNAVMCWIGLIGYVTESQLMANGVVAGGFLFTMAVFYLFLGFRNISKTMQ